MTVISQNKGDFVMRHLNAATAKGYLSQNPLQTQPLYKRMYADKSQAMPQTSWNASDAFLPPLHTQYRAWAHISQVAFYVALSDIFQDSFLQLIDRKSISQLNRNADVLPCLRFLQVEAED